MSNIIKSPTLPTISTVPPVLQVTEQLLSVAIIWFKPPGGSITNVPLTDIVPLALQIICEASTLPDYVGIFYISFGKFVLPLAFIDIYKTNNIFNINE